MDGKHVRREYNVNYSADAPKACKDRLGIKTCLECPLKDCDLGDQWKENAQ
jgi:hypothetical protein